MTIETLTLSIALSDNVRTRPITQGRIKAQGLRLVPKVVHPSEMFWRQLKYADFDVSGMSLSSLFIATARGDRRWVALPIYTLRIFFHTSIMVRTDRGILKRDDLKCKRVGVPEYQQTAALWSRGILEHEFGVLACGIKWFMERSSDKSHGGATGFKPPEGVRLNQIPASTNIGEMLVKDELDATFLYLSNRNLVDRSAIDIDAVDTVRSLFADKQVETRRYFWKTSMPTSRSMSWPSSWLIFSLTSNRPEPDDLNVSVFRSLAVQTSNVLFEKNLCQLSSTSTPTSSCRQKATSTCWSWSPAALIPTSRRRCLARACARLGKVLTTLWTVWARISSSCPRVGICRCNRSSPRRSPNCGPVTRTTWSTAPCRLSRLVSARWLACPNTATSPINCLAELELRVKEQGFIGCLLNPDPTEGDGVPPPALGDEFWYPLYDKYCEYYIPALIHSAGSCQPRESYTLKFINEENIGIISRVNSKVSEHFPNLKLIMLYGGGAIPYHMGRFRSWSIRNGGEFFEDKLKRLHFDTTTYNKDALELMFKVVGTDRVLFATKNLGTGSVIAPTTGRTSDDLKPVIEGLSFLSEKDRENVSEYNFALEYTLQDLKVKNLASGLIS